MTFYNEGEMKVVLKKNYNIVIFLSGTAFYNFLSNSCFEDKSYIFKLSASLTF